MKKYHICFLLLLGLALISLFGVFVIMQNQEEGMLQPPAVEYETEETLPETETMPEDQIVVNQEQIRPAPSEEMGFLLVSEDGFLLVFGSNRSEICLYTHIPITDFPETEREKLRHGIWFPAMEEIYSYLESYTS